MRYLIDSDIVIEHLNDIPAASQLLAQIAVEGIGISVVTYMEAYQGILRTPDPLIARVKLDSFLEIATILAFSEEVARQCAQIREDLRQHGKRVRPRALDLIIAATALHHNLSLVTHNVDDYRDVGELSLYREPYFRR